MILTPVVSGVSFERIRSATSARLYGLRGVVKWECARALTAAAGVAFDDEFAAGGGEPVDGGLGQQRISRRRRAAAEALYRLADAAYERRSLIVTSNLHPSPGWDSTRSCPRPWPPRQPTACCITPTSSFTEGTSLRLAEATAGTRQGHRIRE